LADVKISGLPTSTTPLAGTEVLPIVQGGQTKQVSVANLTAGRAVSATDITLTGVATVPAGTAAAPSVTTTGDTNTGVFFPAADTIAFTEGGVEAMRIHSSSGVSIGNTTDPGATNLSVTGQITEKGGYTVPYNLISTAIPFVVVSSGTMGNNGALSGITAVISAYPNAYVYLPANAISAGSAANWYYAVFSSTTAATIYNNVYTSGTPTVPASPTAFVTTGPGAYTQTTGAYIKGPTITIPANTVGINGQLFIQSSFSANNNANNKFFSVAIDLPLAGVLIPSSAITTSVGESIQVVFASRGINSRQTSRLISRTSQGVLTSYSTQTYDMTASHTIFPEIQLSVATDTSTMEIFQVTVNP
jgi:hypothetical protein